MSKGGSTKSSTVAEPWKEARPLLKSGIDSTQALFDRGGFDVPIYQGQRVADMRPLERRGLRQVARGANQGFSALKDAYGFAGQVGNFGPQDVNQIGDDAMADAINRVSDRFNSAGMEGSSLNEAEAIGAATKALAPIRYGATEDAMQRKLQAAGLMPQLAGAFTQPGMAKATAGNQLTQQDQRILDAERAKFQEESTKEITDQERFANLAAIYGGMGGQTTSSQTPSAFDTVSGLAQTGINAYMAYKLLPLLTTCDRRLKEDITYLGEWRGVPVYEFRYKGDDKLRIGPMADEVPARARVEIDGIQMVNLGAI